MIIEAAERLAQVQEYYFSKKLAQVAEMNKSGEKVINLGIGSPDLAPSEETIDAICATSKKGNTHGYQGYRGIDTLRDSLAQWQQKWYGIELDPKSEILPLIGSKEGIMHISMSFLNPGDGVLIPNPGYPTYSSVSKLAGARIIEYNLKEENDWDIDWEQLNTLDLSGVKLMWVNYPHMPTGKNGSIETFKKIIDFARKNKILVVNDNPYSLILNEGPCSILSIDEAKEVALELNSLSKSHNMAGWRLGWIAGKKEYLNEIIKFKSNMDSGIFLGIQEGAIAALRNTNIWHSEQNEIYAKRRDLVREIISLLDCNARINQVGLFIWAKIPDSIESAERYCDEILHKSRVFITPGFIFGSQGSRYVRLSLCADEAMLKEAKLRIINSFKL